MSDKPRLPAMKHPPRSARAWLPPAALLLLLLALLVLPGGKPDPTSSADPSSGRNPSPARSKPADTRAIAAFQHWLAHEQHAAPPATGIRLARERRAEMKELIRTDPQAALENAVPYALRRSLPREIRSLLETPIRTSGDLTVELACGGPGGRSRREHWLDTGDERLRVFPYGRRAEVMTKEKLSAHGIAIDGLMAMWDDPIREWPAEEIADSGYSGRIAQLGKRLFRISSDEALDKARNLLRASEESIGPRSLPAYREVASGRVPGLFPLAMQDGGGSTGDDLPPAESSPWTEGAKTMLYIRARFADEAPGYEPVTLANAQARQGEAEAFWLDNSYGKSSLATTYTTVVTLPKNGGQYVGNFNTLLIDARQAALAANPAWNHTLFSFHTVVTNTAANSQGQGFGYTGMAQLGGPGSHLIRGFISVRTASHEYGHNLGLNHSEYWLTDASSPIGRDSIPGGYAGDLPDDERIEYGHRFAVMSGQDAPGDFDAGRAHYAVSDKNRLDWLVPSAGDVLRITDSGTFRLYRQDLRAADFGSMAQGVARAIKIDRNATDPTGFANPYRYWLSYRLLPTNGIAGAWLPHGLQVDWRRDGAGFRAVQLDMTPYSRDSGPYGATPGPNADNNDKEDAVLLLGRTFSDDAANIHFTPVARGGTHPNQWLDVEINIGTPADNRPPVLAGFTVGNPTPAVGQSISLAVQATDPDGDPLSYHWDLGDNSVQSGQLNLSSRTKSWTSPGYYPVRVEVSDRKGGKTTASRLIQVGNPAHHGMIHGRVTHAGRPVEAAVLRGGGVNAWSDADGGYVLAGLPLGNATVTAVKDGLTLAARFSNPVPITDSGTFGIDFEATDPWSGGGGVVTVVSPFRVDVPLGFSTRFTARAFDESGNPLAFHPTWSVTGGGTMASSGVFTAHTAGGPFTVTARDGEQLATATLHVIDTGGAAPADGTWTSPAGGSWAESGHWLEGTIAGGAGNRADFSTLNPLADTTVTLDTERAIGSLVFGDTHPASAATWFLTAGGAGSLHLAGSPPTITVHPLGTGRFAHISARLSGFQGLAKHGSGNLLLNNANNSLSGPVNLHAGNLQLNSPALSQASGVTLHAGSLVIATTAANAVGGTITFGGGNLQFNNVPGSDFSAQFSTIPEQPYRVSVGSQHEVAFHNPLASPGGTLTKLGTGTLILAAANSDSGGTTLSAGTLRLAHAAALGSGTLSFQGSSTLQAGVSATLANPLAIAGGIHATFDTNGHNVILSGSLTGPGNLLKTGAGSLTISGGGSSNTLSGAIHVLAGTLAIDSVTPSPQVSSFANMKGSISVADGATFHFSQSFGTEALDNDLSLRGAGNGGLGALNLWRNATATGTITLADDATISHTFNTATITGPISGQNRRLTLATTVANQPGMTISGPIQLGTGGLTVQGAANSGNFSIRLTGSTDYSGETHVASGTLMLSGNARLDDRSTVRIAATGVLHLDFSGADTVTALILDGTAMPQGSYGSPSSAAAHRSERFAGSGFLQVGPGEDYEAWASLHGITGGPTADHDQDGISNLLEYALADGQRGGVLSGQSLVFTKRGPPYGGDLTYIIETSDSLAAGSWIPAVVHGPDRLNEPIRIDFTAGQGPPRQFARLRVLGP